MSEHDLTVAPLQIAPPPVPTATVPRVFKVDSETYLKSIAELAGVTPSDIMATHDVVICEELDDCSGWRLRPSPHAHRLYTP